MARSPDAIDDSFVTDANTFGMAERLAAADKRGAQETRWVA